MTDEQDPYGDDYAVIDGTRRNPSAVVVPAETLPEEFRNCWTAYLVLRGTMDECQTKLRELDRERRERE